MDMQTGRDFDPPAQSDRQELTFHWLYQRVQGLVDHSIYSKAGRVEKWSFRVGVASAVIGVLGSLLPERWIQPGMALLLVMVCLSIEIGGFALGWALTLRREARQYLQPRLSHAREMDSEFSQWQAVIAELRNFHRKEREQRLRYVTTLRTGMIDRMGLIYGGLQRLGPFPLLVAFYLQYRGWKQGNWGGVFDIGWAGAVLVVMMVLLYLLGWMLIGLRVRLDTYVALLEGSIQEPEPELTPAPDKAHANPCKTQHAAESIQVRLPR
ncbi:hypothetical protein [Stenotrophomonas sp. 3(2025)]|uniref:hypothetical protein n=1 Tax=Stenotrophomonas sp. 3(2025) TaxID=3456023 RepID=UPI00404469DE